MLDNLLKLVPLAVLDFGVIGSAVAVAVNYNGYKKSRVMIVIASAGLWPLIYGAVMLPFPDVNSRLVIAVSGLVALVIGACVLDTVSDIKRANCEKRARTCWADIQQKDLDIPNKLAAPRKFVDRYCDSAEMEAAAENGEDILSPPD